MTLPLKGGIWTTEWWGLLATLATSVITLLVLFGWVRPQSEADLSKSISAVIAALGALIVQWGGYHSYNKGRTEIKVAALQSGAVEPVDGADPVNLGDSEEVTFVYNGVTICLSRR